MQFSEKLQKLRKERGLSQEALADAVGVSRQAVSKWESLQAYPEIDKLIALSEFFSVSIDSLVKDGDSQPDDQKAENPDKSYNFYPHYRPFYYFQYEYKSKRRVFGLPLVHINLGRGFHLAKGIIAIGNVAVGVVALGAISFGGLCIGGLAAGLFAFGGFAIGGLAAGGISAGLLAFGGIAFGGLAIGGVAVGGYSIGGMAVASDIAVGGYARAHVAIGDSAIGVKTLVTHNHNFGSIRASQVRELIHEAYPRLPKAIVTLFTSLFGPG
jgi:transcriptional regulator with XRE-family HTH domain